MFTKDKKGTFKYTFAHWAAYQMTALNLGCWKFRFLFHDIEKPLLKLLGFKYETIRKIHRKYSKHHLTYHNYKKIDWLGVVIDWECSGYTKLDAPLNARQTYEKMLDNPNLNSAVRGIMKNKVPAILSELRL